MSVSVGVEWPSSSNHLEHVLCLLMGPREAVSHVVQNLLEAALQCHGSGGGQCPGEKLRTYLENIPP